MGELISLIDLAVIIIFTLRGCYFSWKAFADDDVAWWITVSEATASACWILVGLDVLLVRLYGQDQWFTAVLFAIAFTVKAISTVIKSEKAYKVIYILYKKYK